MAVAPGREAKRAADESKCAAASLPVGSLPRRSGPRESPNNPAWAATANAMPCHEIGTRS
jgi:hypothetical protein